jgi:hypothetical protein
MSGSNGQAYRFTRLTPRPLVPDRYSQELLLKDYAGTSMSAHPIILDAAQQSTNRLSISFISQEIDGVRKEEDWLTATDS